MMRVCGPRRRICRAVGFLLLPVMACLALIEYSPAPAYSQELTPAMIDEAVRRSGMSRQELQRRYGQQVDAAATDQADQSEPGRTTTESIDDAALNLPWRDTNARAVLPFSSELEAELAAAAEVVVPGDSVGYFGADFFHLDSGMFTPPSFGPVADDYRLGIGDEIIINAWGGIDFQITRVVDRDGAIILPRSGKVPCAGRTLAEVDQSVRTRLAESHASIETDDSGTGDTIVEVTLGHLRPIRVFVVGAVTRPGSYELNSASRMLTALAMAGGPTISGSLRQVRLVRGDDKVAELDLYDYLLGGSRAGDARLQDGDTVFIPDIGASGRVFTLESSRRIAERWKLIVDAFIVLDALPDDRIYTFNRDDNVTVELRYYF